MNRFLLQGNNVCWQDDDGAVHSIARGNVSRTGERLDYSGFREFLGADGDMLERGMFELWCIDILDNILYLGYESTIVPYICATLRITLPGGDKQITYTTCDECDGMTLEEFEGVDKKYFATCDMIRKMRTELIHASERVAQLEAENAHLREENTELRFRPGGPGYYESAEHFAELALQ